MNNYTEELKTIFKISEQEALNNNDELVTSKHILLAIFKTENSIIDTLLNYDLSYEIIKEKLCNDKKCGWNEVDVLERNKIFSFSEEYMSFMNKSKTEREATKTVLSMLKENGFILSGNGYGTYSGVQSHTGRGIAATYLEREV